MGNRGIHTSEAEWWCHFHPLECVLYLYRRQECLDHVERNNMKTTVKGKSREGSVTGRGYLIPKSASFLIRRKLASSRVNVVEWAKVSNREAGLRGEEIVFTALKEGAFEQIGTIVVRTQARDAQLNGWDMESANGRIEVKTECVYTPNLFVQTWESGHVPTLRKDGSVDNVTKLPAFEESSHKPTLTGFVGYDAEDRLVHYCYCGAWAAYGFGVKITAGVLGSWYCREHRPVDAAADSALNAKRPRGATPGAV